MNPQAGFVRIEKKNLASREEKNREPLSTVLFCFEREHGSHWTVRGAAAFFGTTAVFSCPLINTRTSSKYLGHACVSWRFTDSMPVSYLLEHESLWTRIFGLTLTIATEKHRIRGKKSTPEKAAPNLKENKPQKYGVLDISHQNICDLNVKCKDTPWTGCHTSHEAWTFRRLST